MEAGDYPPGDIEEDLMEEQNEKGLAELLVELNERVNSLEKEVSYLRSHYYGTTRPTIDEIVEKVEQSLARKIRTQLKKD